MDKTRSSSNKAKRDKDSILVEVKKLLEILRKHRLNQKVIYKYNIENVVEVIIKDIELKQIPFNGNCHKIMEQIFYLNNYLSNNLKYRATYTSESMVDKINGSNKFNIDVKLNEYGFNYECIFNEELNTFY